MPTAAQVLSRFPRHLDLDQPGKVFGEVVGALGEPLDSQISQLGKLRRTHRAGEVEQRIDLLRLAALHGFDDRMLVPVQRRLGVLAGLDLADDAALDQALTLLGLRVDEALTRGPDEPDDGAARERLGGALDAAAAHDAVLALGRRTLTAAVADQRSHATTVAGLLAAAADYLGLQVVEVPQTESSYWHLARCRDRIAIAPGVPPGAGGAPAVPEPLTGRHLLALEENPPFLADLGPTPRRHGDCFHVTRHGFEAVPTTVIVRGRDDRSVAPLIMNVDDGEGLAASFAVPDGALLRFERDGRVELDGTGVARRCYVISGAVFAQPGGHPQDFVFADAEHLPAGGHGTPEAGRVGHFAVTRPVADAFDDVPSLPHTDGLLRPLRLARGQTRFAVFVAAGAYAGVDEVGQPQPASPHPVAARFDESVFRPDPAGPSSLEIGFAWDEREAYAVRLWLPAAFAALDVEGESSLREVVRLLLDRHRAAGVHLSVAYADPRWVLGTGVLRDLDSDQALGVLVAGTQAWVDGTDQPPPTPAPAAPR